MLFIFAVGLAGVWFSFTNDVSTTHAQSGATAIFSPAAEATPEFASDLGIVVKDGRFPVSGNAFDSLSAGELNALSIVA